MTDRSPSSPSRAVIIGGSLAGLLAASAVKDHVAEVEIVDAHDIPAGPEPRAGVPQAAHLHILVSGGARAIEELLPGAVGQLLASGAHRVPMTTNMVMYAPEGWYRRWQRDTHFLISGSRDLTDFVIRQHVLKHPQVTLRPHTRATALLGDAGRVTGVRLRGPDGVERDTPADLVVDASGRSTRTPRWLTALGVTGLTEDQIDVGYAYASRLYRAPVPTDNWPVVNVQAAPAQTGHGRAGGILPIEEGRWHVSLMGTTGSQPTRDPDDFEAFARTLRHPVVADLLAHAEPLTDVTVTHSTISRRYYYERLSRWPEGLVALGDAVAALNPVYGHGMSVAALGALALRDQLAADGLGTGLARRAQRAVARPVDLAWSLAAGQDVHHPTARGRTAGPADRLLHRFTGRLSRTATGSHLVATAMTEVMTLQAPGTALLRPAVLTAALLGPLRPQLTSPAFTREERRLMREAGIVLSAHPAPE
ncbi:FAD-dependent monooxygenase [Streptomyces sp. NPDC004610]|uniref:NAD(P)/FAD-dependent oxidoreductase n=1 Tax=unclassified Streptomyces TaxID=2593676 RepID=UPI0033B57A71